jgi:hypothetical protein
VKAADKVGACVRGGGPSGLVGEWVGEREGGRRCRRRKSGPRGRVVGVGDDGDGGSDCGGGGGGGGGSDGGSDGGGGGGGNRRGQRLRVCIDCRRELVVEAVACRCAEMRTSSGGSVSRARTTGARPHQFSS